jgi:hypothetical protein
MHRLPHLHPHILRAQHLHGPDHHPDPVNHGLEPENGTQDQSVGCRYHEFGVDVRTHFPDPSLPFDLEVPNADAIFLNSATGTSVGRFIIYYYRYAPSNTDRTWNIGNSISIAEPAVHIMTACAPATKCLFRSLFPYFDRTPTPVYYENRQSTHPSRFGSRGFSFGLSANRTIGGVEEMGCVEETRYGGRAGGKRVSTESSESVVVGAKGADIEMKSPRNNSCTRTDNTVGDEVIEAEPNHCLAHAK